MSNYKPVKRRIWKYDGDINIEHGGHFVCTDTWEWDYVEVVRCEPASNMGGPDNVFLIEVLTVNIPAGEVLERALDTIGYDHADMKAEFAKASPSEKRWITTLACLSSGHYDVVDSEWVRIGPKDGIYHRNGAEWRDAPPLVKQLRGNTSLRRYVREKCA